MIRALIVFGAGVLVFAFGIWQFTARSQSLPPAPAVSAKQPAHRQPAHKHSNRTHPRRARTSVRVTVQGLSYVFSPATVTVRRGTTVTWKNYTAAGHTITSVTPRLFNRPLSGRGQASVTFVKPGTYQYYCAIHPYMLGVVVVQAGT